jgi:hypothetical protein
MATLHAHVETVSADCDGPMYRSYIERFNADETEESGKVYNDFSDLNFMNRVFTNHCGPYAVYQMTVKVDNDGFEWNESTEEGHRSGHVEWCRDECEDYNSQRDVFAEQMNY